MNTLFARLPSRINRYIGLIAAISIALSACNTPTPPTPEGTPEIKVEIRPQITAGPSPTPRPPGQPILVDTSPVRGEELPADKPLQLTFDQPMDHASVEQALSVKASDGTPLAGKFTWTSENVVQFIPTSAWQRAARYDVLVGATAKSKTGDALARPESFQINTIGKLAVAQTIPADAAQEVAADATITVLFNRPVVSLTTLAGQAALPQPVSFNPPIPGKGTWLNTSIYIYQPSQQLQAGTAYQGKVSAGLTDTQGALLDADYTWSFSVAAPVVKFITPDTGVGNIDLRTPVSVTFSQKMNRNSAQGAFSITPPVEGSFRWADEQPQQDQGRPIPRPKAAGATAAGPNVAPNLQLGEVMAFVPDADYQRSLTYTVSINAGAQAVSGSGATKATSHTSFKVIDMPAVVSTRPADGDDRADPQNGLAIRFSAPMSIPAILQNLRVDPPVSLTEVYSYYDDANNEFSLSVELRPSTAYTVRIGAKTADKYGLTIGQDTDVRFSTGPLAPFVALQNNGLVGTYNAALPTQLYASYRNVTRLDLELSKLTVQQFFDLSGSENAFEKQSAFKPADKAKVRNWTITTDGALNEAKNVKLTLEEAGGALPTGIYLLTLSAPEPAALDKNFQPVRHILIVGNLHIALKRADRDGLVWLTNLQTGAPMAGVTVSFRDNNFSQIMTSTTSGEANFQGQALVTFPPRYRPTNVMYAIAGEPGAANFGVAWSEMSQDINVYDFNLPSRYQAEPHFAYVYTDRPIYRPGQMVFFKGIVRTDNDARYSVPADIQKLDLTIANGQGQSVFSQTARLNATGTFTGEFALDPGAATGQYYVQACVPNPNAARGEQPCSYFGVPFQVSAYRAPEFEIALGAEKADYLDGETIKATLDAKYFFGGNVAGAKVAWTLLASDYTFDRYTGPGNYSFDDTDYTIEPFRRGPGFNESIASGNGTTDSSGKLVISVPADVSKRKRSARFTLEASVTDPNDQSVSARTEVIVHKGSFYFGIATDQYVYSAGDVITASVISVDWQGKPLASKAGLVAFNRRVWFTTQQEDAGRGTFYTSVPSDTQVFSATITTDTEAKAVAAFTPARGGEYRFVASGEGANSAATNAYVSSAKEFVAWRVDNNDRLDLKADKASYQIGETAKVLVPSPFQGATQALLTIERGNFIQRKTIVLNTNSDVLDIPIDESFVPNVYVSVLIVRGVDAKNPVPAYRLGYTSFTVNPKGFALNVAITPDKEQYGPRDTATYDIHVTDPSGAPAQAELSLALVDKAVLNLIDPNAEPMLDAFYGQRGLSVRTADSLNVNVDRITDKVRAASAAKGGGGGGSASADTLFTRKDFKDTAYWSAVVTTDENGAAQVHIILPDNLTTWVMGVKAFTVSTGPSATLQVGDGKNEVISTKPLLVRPVTPRFFVVGDIVTLGAVVNNNTTADVTAEVGIASTNLVLTGGNAIQGVTVKAGGSARVDWTVTVQDAASSEITMTAAAGGLQDSAQPGLQTAQGGGIPILHYVAPETVATAGDLDQPGRKLEVIALPPRLDTGLGDLTVHVDTGLGAAAARSVEALDAYPYESADWAASRMIVHLALARAKNEPPDPSVVNGALQRLYGEQKSEGGWGWWSGDPVDPLITAHIVLAMTRAQASGLAVDGNVLKRANDYLTQQLKAVDELGSTSEANRQAYILFVQAEGGRGDGGRLGALFEAREKLSHYAKALLAMALNSVNKGDTRIKTLLADLNSAEATSATGVSWTEREFDWVNFFTNTRSTAIILDALARLDSGNALAVNTVRWLMAAREGDTWHTTQETEWAITAFADWIGATGEANSSFTWRTTLNDNTLLQGQASPLGETLKTVIGLQTLLRGQSSDLAFERGTGEGRLYYTAHVRSFLPVDTAPMVNRGVVIERKYESADCVPSPDKPCDAILLAKLGQNVRVRLTVVAPNTLYYVRLTDPLPGGAEIVDTSLKTSQTVQSSGLPTAPRFGDTRGWGWWWFVESQSYDDRMAAFASYLPAGTYEYTYVFRSSIAGQFKVMPASAELTYFPEVFGRSAGAAFAITR